MSVARPSYAPLAERSFELVGLPAETVMRPEGAPRSPIDGLALVAPAALSAVPDGAPRFRAVADGNRSAILLEPRVEHAGRTWLVSVKGVGAMMPLFGDEAGPRRIHGESWMGEAPFGGQGEDGARTAVEVTSLALAGELRGAAICPLTSVVAIPERAIDRASFWYRRHRGAVLSEHRLVPSDVRVFHGSSRTLGRDPRGVLEAFGVLDVAALDAFVERYLASGIALLTLAARSAAARDGETGSAIARDTSGALAAGPLGARPTSTVVGLDFDDAWLDKDAVVAPDGTLCFADLETLDWRPLTAARMRRQLGRNHYELFATLDLLLDVRDGWTGVETDRHLRRESVIARTELALAGDPVVRASVTESGLDLVLSPEHGPSVTLRLVDRSGR